MDWKVQVTYEDGTIKTIKAKNKFDAGMKRDSYIGRPGVERADVFEGDDFIDPCEL